MTPSDRKRYHAARAQFGFDHDEVKQVLQLRGYIDRSTSELSTQQVNLLMYHLSRRDLSKLPPCPDSEDARAIATEKAAQSDRSDQTDRSEQTVTYTGHKGLMRLYVTCATSRNRACPIQYGKDDRLLAGMRRAYTDAQLASMIRRYWCIEAFPGGHKVQQWLERPDVVRTIGLMHTIADGLLPELYDQEAVRRVHKLLSERIRNAKRTARTQTGEVRIHAPSSAGEFADSVRGPA